jgi:hypothetical protein
MKHMFHAVNTFSSNNWRLLSMKCHSFLIQLFKPPEWYAPKPKIAHPISALPIHTKGHGRYHPSQIYKEKETAERNSLKITKHVRLVANKKSSRTGRSCWACRCCRF